MKKISEVLVSLGFFLLVTAILLTVIDWSCFRKEFYRRELEKNDTVSVTGMSADGVLESIYVLLDYLRDERQDIIITETVNGTVREVFNERETLHMIDVKALYRNAVTARNVFAGAGLILLLCSVFLQRAHRSLLLKNGLRNGSLFMLGVVAFVAVWALVDFNGFWTNFHLLFFNNDLWLLDPRTSIMINLLPGGLFFDLVTGIIIRFLVCMILLYCIVSFLVPKLERGTE